jgi:hypothetical protein
MRPSLVSLLTVHPSLVSMLTLHPNVVAEFYLLQELYSVSRQLASVVVPHEYGS